MPTMANGRSYDSGNITPVPAASVSVLATSTAVTTANTARVYGLLVNTSDTDIWVNTAGAAAVVGTGIYLKAGGGAYEFGVAFCNNTSAAIYAIAAAAGGKNLSFYEGTGV